MAQQRPDLQLVTQHQLRQIAGIAAALDLALQLIHALGQAQAALRMGRSENADGGHEGRRQGSSRKLVHVDHGHLRCRYCLAV